MRRKLHQFPRGQVGDARRQSGGSMPILSLNSVTNSLPAAKTSLSFLHESMPKQESDLLQFAADCLTEPRLTSCP